MTFAGDGEPVRHGVVAVVIQERRFLIVRRAAGILAGGSWCFVGGGIEEGETQAEALVREFREEVAGDIHPLRKVWEYQRPDGKLVLHWWLARWRSAALCANPREVAQIAWLTTDEIERLPGVLPSNIEFIQAVGRTLV